MTIPTSMTQRPLLTQRRLTVVAFVFILIVDLLGCLYLADQIRSAAHLPFASDEAVHANGGLELALDLKAGDPIGFLVHTYQQAYYPPTQSWLLAPAFVLFGTTETVARMVSLACLFFSVLILFAIGLELHEKQGWLVGLLAGLLPFTSQQSLTISAMTMQEPTGFLFTALAMWMYIRGVKRLPDAGRKDAEDAEKRAELHASVVQSSSAYRYLVGASLALVAVTLSKYLFGVYLGTTLVAARVVEARFNPKRLLTRANLALFAPAVILLVVWFLDTSKLDDFWRYANVPSLQADEFSLEQYTFYWRSIVVHYTAALPLGILLLAGFGYALTQWRTPILIVLALHILIAIAGMTIRRTINPRFVYVAVPLIYLLGGVLVAQIMESVQRSRARRGIGWAAIGLAGIAVIITAIPGVRDRYTSYPAMLQVQIKTDPRAFDAYAWIARNVLLDRRSILMLNYWDQFSGEGLRWYLLSRDTTPGRRAAEVNIVPRYASPVNADTLPDFLRTLDELGLTTVIGFAGGPEGSSNAWVESQPAIGAALDLVAQNEYDMAQWDRTLLLQLRDNAFNDPAALAEATKRYSYGYHVTATIYRLQLPRRSPVLQQLLIFRIRVALQPEPRRVVWQRAARDVGGQQFTRAARRH